MVNKLKWGGNKYKKYNGDVILIDLTNIINLINIVNVFYI